MPDKPPSVVLERYSEEELKAAIKTKRKVDTIKKKLLYSAIGFLLTGTTLWNKDNIIRVLYPPLVITQQEYKVATSDNYIILEQLELYNAAHNKKLQELHDDVAILSTRLTIIETYFTQ